MSIYLCVFLFILKFKIYFAYKNNHTINKILHNQWILFSYQ